jgi:hypothetical protein
MIATRFAPATLVLLAVALLPTVIHSYVGLTGADALQVAAIQPTLAGMTSVTTKRSVDWGQRRLASQQWFERAYSSGSDTVVLTVAKSYDHKTLYHHPELAISYHYANYDRYEVKTFPGAPDMPVHVLSNGGNGPIGLYVLHYDGRFVADPIRFQLRTALEQLVEPRKPMTIIYARDDASKAVRDLPNTAAARVLMTAVQQFTAQR